MAWFNSVPESVIDGWVAYYSLESEESQGKAERMMDPMEAYKRLQERFS